MSRRFRRGLVVGKFSPLHLGHEHLIASALEACREVIVLSYCSPEFARCDAAARERWLRLRAPAAQAVVLDEDRLARLCSDHGLPTCAMPVDADDEDTHRRFVGWLLQRCLNATVDAVFTSEAYGDDFAASLTLQFRAADPGHAPVVHVSVDPARATVPVSGSAARSAPAAHRSMLAPEVYADMVPRLCLLGGESTGKTTLARALAARLGTGWVAEYGRERWLELGGGVLGPADLLDIARGQVDREVAAAQRSSGWLICDTSPLTTLVYALIDHGSAVDALHRLARRHYDLVALCDADTAFTQDGTRRDDAFRQQQQALTLQLLHEHGTPFVRVHGSVEERIAQILEHLPAPEWRLSNRT